MSRAAPAAQKTIEAKAPVVPEEPAPKAMPTPAPIIEAAREPVAGAQGNRHGPADGRNAARGCARRGEGLGRPEEDGEIGFAEQCPAAQQCRSRPRYHRDQPRPAAALRRQRVEHDRDDQSRRRDGSRPSQRSPRRTSNQPPSRRSRPRRLPPRSRRPSQGRSPLRPLAPLAPPLAS